MIRLLIAAALLMLPSMAQVSDNFSGTLSNWTLQAGSDGVFQVSSGTLIETAANSTTLKVLYWTTPSLTANYSVTCSIVKPTTDQANIGVLGRWKKVDATNCGGYLGIVRNVAASTDKIQLYYYSGLCTGGGTFNLLGGVDEEWTNGHYLRLDMAGTHISLSRSTNGTDWTTKVDIANETTCGAPCAGPGTAAVRFTHPEGSLDNFSSTMTTGSTFSGQLLIPVRL